MDRPVHLVVRLPYERPLDAPKEPPSVSLVDHLVLVHEGAYTYGGKLDPAEG